MQKIIRSLGSETEFLKEIYDGIHSIAVNAHKNNQTFRLCLSGGNSVKKVLEYLTTREIKTDFWEIWMVDERCVPQNHEESNSKLIRDTFLIPLKGSDHQFHPMIYPSPIESNLMDYRDSIQKISYFDLCLLGIGNDGHVASLFPNLEEERWFTDEEVFTISNSPKLPSHRMTLTMKRINLSNYIYGVALGPDKKELLERINTSSNLPVHHLKAKIETKLFFHY
jgi:6-phosphogluconolactonase